MRKLIVYSNTFIIVLILFSCIAVSIETIPNLNPSMVKFLYIAEIVITITFTIEYLIRIYFAKHRLRFIFSFYGIIDLASILPFYLSLPIGLNGIRIVRFFKIFRILKMMRYSRAINRFARAIILAREEIILFMIAIVILLFFSATGIYYFENPVQPESFKSIPHSLWWAVATITTVGYGDVYPITLGGRIFTSFILMIAIGLIAVPSGLIASALSYVRNADNRKEGKG